MQKGSSNTVGYELVQSNFENNTTPNNCTDSNSSELFHSARAPSQAFNFAKWCSSSETEFQTGQISSKYSKRL